MEKVRLWSEAPSCASLASGNVVPIITGHPSARTKAQSKQHDDGRNMTARLYHGCQKHGMLSNDIDSNHMFHLSTVFVFE